MTNYFDPAERIKEKQRAREEDDRALASGEITREELWRRNSFFGALDLSKWKIVRRPKQPKG